MTVKTVYEHTFPLRFIERGFTLETSTPLGEDIGSRVVVYLIKPQLDTN